MWCALPSRAHCSGAAAELSPLTSHWHSSCVRAWLQLHTAAPADCEGCLPVADGCIGGKGRVRVAPRGLARDGVLFRVRGHTHAVPALQWL